MQIQHIGYQIRGFYRVAKIGHRWDMNPHAQKRIDILRFWEVHGTAATCDAFKVSRRTLYLAANTRPSRRRPGSPDAALTSTKTPPPRSLPA